MYPQWQLHLCGHGKADQPPRTTIPGVDRQQLTSNLDLCHVPNTLIPPKLEKNAKFQAELPQLWQVGSSSSWRYSIRSVSELVKLCLIISD